MKQHHYKQNVIWTGNKGNGTSSYDGYDRDYTVKIDGKLDLLCSSDTAFRGDATKMNPEDLLLSSLSSCHMLWFLHLCSDAGITVVEYIDNPEAWMDEIPGEGGRFSKMILHPQVKILEKGREDEANNLHIKAGKKCFITNSCNFPVEYQGNCQSI